MCILTDLNFPQANYIATKRTFDHTRRVIEELTVAHVNKDLLVNLIYKDLNSPSDMSWNHTVRGLYCRIKRYSVFGSWVKFSFCQDLFWSTSFLSFGLLLRAPLTLLT